MSDFQTPDHNQASFATTNSQTISQRVALLRELLPTVGAIAEVCGGSCLKQWQAYQAAFSLKRFVAVDIDPVIVRMNKANGINCLLGNALDKEVAKSLLTCDVIFFGPPLSENCSGHRFIPFQQVSPSFQAFTTLLFGDLGYQGTIVCIGSKQTSLGDWRWLYDQIKTQRPNVGLRLILHSYSTLTGRGETTEPRLKYIEGWFSTDLGDEWERRISSEAMQ